MSIIYSRLGEVALRHEYFKDGVARDLVLWPSEETSRIFQNGKIIFRQFQGGMILLYRAEEDETTPISPLTQPVSFYFFFQPKNPADFLQISDLDDGSNLYSSGKLPFFFNVPANASSDESSPENLSYDLLDGLRAKAFGIELTLEPFPPSVRIKVRKDLTQVVSPGKDENGLPLPDLFEIAPDDQGKIRFTFDLRGKAEGIYTFTLRDAGNTTDLWSKTYWVGNEPASPLGLIRLEYVNAPSNLYGSKEHYRLTIPSQKSRWTYLIVNGNQKVDLLSKTLEIEDVDADLPPPYSTYQFDQVGDSPSTDIKINNRETVVFRSQVEIPFFETPKLSLRLVENPGSKVLVADLPNPSRAAPTKKIGADLNTEIYVFI
ncbi:hypothetical protein [Algoriphagus halophilus]|uniref:Uncharacterized protein n=1 Tax=Algoriphagus halophilus TaxID=226505 RepID=A0A1N6GJU0_9BACT|nr:hypothetical protein [Algoriphagus halophilus]SIO07770.1 hypothetical protein SAMN05444394_3306 [Algoriphagus halophilus]